MDFSNNGIKYGSNDMAPIGCDDCNGCSSCCREMGDTVIQDPYDFWLFSSNMRLAGGIPVSFEILISPDGPWELSVHDGIVLPNIKMVEDGRCPFLSNNGRCSIHKIRSGLCRLFPLCRSFEADGTINYYVLGSELGCEKQKGAGEPVVIKEWLGIDNIEKYEQYQIAWHSMKKKLAEYMTECNPERAQQLQAMFLAHFYGKNYGKDFFREFEGRLEEFTRQL